MSSISNWQDPVTWKVAQKAFLDVLPSLDPQGGILS